VRWPAPPTFELRRTRRQAQADRACVLQKGRVVLQGTADELRDDARLAALRGV
jgi:ABC-type branched-subunit amino acid transport system ATPase component